MRDSLHSNWFIAKIDYFRIIVFHSSSSYNGAACHPGLILLSYALNNCSAMIDLTTQSP